MKTLTVDEEASVEALHGAALNVGEYSQSQLAGFLYLAFFSQYDPSRAVSAAARRLEDRIRERIRDGRRVGDITIDPYQGISDAKP